MEANRQTVQVHLVPSLIPPGSLRGGIAVVIDVLRATTCMVHALAAGCERIIPCGEIDEARAVAASLPPGSFFLAGERQGVPIEGFAMGNSPGDCTPERCAGKTMVMTTTNGTRAILASLEADRVFVAGFVNQDATLAALRADGRPVHLVCSGTDGHISWEDTLLAGALANDLSELDQHDEEDIRLNPVHANRPIETILTNDSALIADDLWFKTARMADGGLIPLVDVLREGRGGRRVRELGYEADIDLAARVDHFTFIAELLREPLRIVRAD